MYIINCNPSETHDDAQFALGQRGVDVHGNEYVYLQADGATSKGAACIMHAKGTQADEVTTTNSDAHPVCVAVVAVADDDYAWFQRYGNVEIETAAVSDEAQLSTTTTAGRLDDSGGNKVYGCHAEEAQGTAGNLTECFISYPFTDA